MFRTSEGIGQALADTANAALTNQDVMWFIVGSLLTLGILVLVKETAREWFIEAREREYKREDEKQARIENLKHEALMAAKKSDHEALMTTKKYEHEKETRMENLKHEALVAAKKSEHELYKRLVTIEQKAGSSKEIRDYKLERKRLKIEELGLQIRLRELNKTSQNP